MAAIWRVEYVKPAAQVDDFGNVSTVPTRYVSPDMEPDDAAAYAALVGMAPDATEIEVLSR